VAAKNKADRKHDREGALKGVEETETTLLKRNNCPCN